MSTCNFHTTCAHLGVNWDLASVVQQKGESIREFIQCFCNKRNIIRKLAMKNPWRLEALFTIANRYALFEEVTLDTREQKKEKDSGHADHPSLSRGHDKNGKAYHSVNAVERP
jgi:hypothetical protein